MYCHTTAFVTRAAAIFVHLHNCTSSRPIDLYMRVVLAFFLGNMYDSLNIILMQAYATINVSSEGLKDDHQLGPS